MVDTRTISRDTGTLEGMQEGTLTPNEGKEKGIEDTDGRLVGKTRSGIGETQPGTPDKEDGEETKLGNKPDLVGEVTGTSV